MDGLRVVLSGREPDGTRWSVTAGPAAGGDGQFWTFVHRQRPGGRPARSGMGGPKLHGGNVVDVWAGRADGTPPFVLLRADPSVEQAAVTTRGSLTIDVAMSPVVDDFGLRFGAAALPDNDEPDRLTLRLEGGRTVTGRVPWPSPRHPSGHR